MSFAAPATPLTDGVKRFRRALLLPLVLSVAAGAGPARAQTAPAPFTNIFSQPLSRAGAVDIALRQNTTIRKGQADLEAAHGIVLQLRSIAFPTVSAGGGYNRDQSTLIENFPLPAPLNNFIQIPDQNWNSDIRVQQSIYNGGRMTSAFRSAKLTRAQSLLNYQNPSRPTRSCPCAWPTTTSWWRNSRSRSTRPR